MKINRTYECESCGLVIDRELKHLSDDPRVLRMWGELDRLLG